MIIWNWLKKFAIKEGIRELSGLEPLISAKVKKAQSELNNVSPDGFAHELVIEMQVKLCETFDVDPKNLGIGA